MVIKIVSLIVYYVKLSSRVYTNGWSRGIKTACAAQMRFQMKSNEIEKEFRWARWPEKAYYT